MSSGMRCLLLAIALLAGSFACRSKRVDRESDGAERRVTASAPSVAIPPGAPRAEQCALHVKAGLRGNALTLIAMAEHIADDAKRQAQSCAVEESRPVESCLDPTLRQELAEHARQRQRDCERWSSEVAACVFELPGATGCKRDELPLWRAPRVEGPPGPSLAWSAEIEAGSDDIALAWAPAGTLIVADDAGVKAMRAGAVLWQAPAAPRQVWIAGQRAVARDRELEDRLIALDLATGKPRGGATIDVSGDIRPAGADALLAVTADRGLVRLSPAAWTAAGRAGQTVLAALGEQESFDEYTPLPLSDGSVVVTSSSRLERVDTRGKPGFSIRVGGSLTAAIPLDRTRFALVADEGITIFDAAACGGVADVELADGVCDGCPLAETGCAAAFQRTSSMDTIAAVPAGDAVAWNDHGMIERTRLLAVDPGRSWEATTGGFGTPGADAAHIYVVVGDLAELRVLALDRGTGKPVWQTELARAGSPDQDWGSAQIAVGPGWLAARVGGKVYALALPAR